MSHNPDIRLSPSGLYCLLQLGWLLSQPRYPVVPIGTIVELPIKSGLMVTTQISGCPHRDKNIMKRRTLWSQPRYPVVPIGTITFLSSLLG